MFMVKLPSREIMPFNFHVLYLHGNKYVLKYDVTKASLCVERELLLAVFAEHKSLTKMQAKR